MPNCQAITAANTPCGNNAKLYDGQQQFCGTHHKVKLRTDPAYVARITEFKTDPAVVAARAAFRVAFEHQQVAVAPERRRATAAVTAARAALLAAENAVRERQQPGALEAERAAAAARRAVVAARRAHAQALNAAWAAQAAAAQLANEQIANLRAAAVALLPAGQVAHAALTAATRALDVARDRAHVATAALAIATGAEIETATAELAAANAAVHAAFVAREVAFEHGRHALNAFNAANDRYMIARAGGAHAGGAHAPAPQVFQRDPDGGIDLRAFATDRQSVHRSGVVSAVEAAIHRLIERPLDDDQRTLDEAVAVLSAPELRVELQRDFNMAHAFGVPYAKVLDHVWGTLRAHTHKTELERRFVEEMRDGRGMCHVGKMTRLVNVLAGFDDAVGDLMPPAELFRNRLALLADRPLAEREPAARDLFREFAIPDVEQAAWLEPLLEA